MPLSRRQQNVSARRVLRTSVRHRPRGHKHGDHHHDHSGDHPGHDRDHHDDHAHDHNDFDNGVRATKPGGVVVIRPTSGLSGDMMLAGLACMAGAGSKELGAIAGSLGLPENCVSLERRAVNAVFGWGCRISLPDSGPHRTWADIRQIIAAGKLAPDARDHAERTFDLLAEVEGRIHGIAKEAVRFHEVGAMDSILDICLCAELFTWLAPARFVCGPLPLCDGTVKCEHGLLPAPAPAVLELLRDVPVRGIASEGETVTPTAIALLKGLGAEFGPWPEMTIARTALVYGRRVLPGVANGALFASGTPSAGQISRA
jgi:pyridinium-3,5-bisthiocarboxylic acid mononucleotide nickel chelatase